jgi:hypothetical protein
VPAGAGELLQHYDEDDDDRVIWLVRCLDDATCKARVEATRAAKATRLAAQVARDNAVRESALTALGERALVIQHIERWRDKPFITDYERALLDALIAASAPTTLLDRLLSSVRKYRSTSRAASTVADPGS